MTRTRTPNEAGVILIKDRSSHVTRQYVNFNLRRIVNIVRKSGYITRILIWKESCLEGYVHYLYKRMTVGLLE